MLATPFGIVTLETSFLHVCTSPRTITNPAASASPSHPQNVPSPMLVTLSGIVTLVRLLHPQNAQSPMLVTLSGIVTLVRHSQP